MPSKHSRHIALTDPLVKWVDRQVAQGEYTSVSELIRTAIRLVREQDLSRRAGASASLLSQTDTQV